MIGCMERSLWGKADQLCWDSFLEVFKHPSQTVEKTFQLTCCVSTLEPMDSSSSVIYLWFLAVVTGGVMVQRLMVQGPSVWSLCLK